MNCDLPSRKGGRVLKVYLCGLFLLLCCGSELLKADELSWGGTYVANWDGFGTSPYTAIDTTNNQSIQLFCLDFNDEIAPPMTWDASIIPLTKANVAGTGAYQNVYAAQYGGAYNTLVQNAYNSTPPSQRAPGETLSQVEVSGPPFAYVGDKSAPPGEPGTNSTLQGAGAYKVDMSASANNPYTRYLEAAWLFSDIRDGLSQSPQDTQTDMIAQAAAWELLVNTSNLGFLTNAVDTYGKSNEVGNTGAYQTVATYSFANYLTPSAAVSGISFEQAVDLALQDAQTAVNGGWSPGNAWSIVTATPQYVIGYGEPVQEFLSFGATPDQAPLPNPEPADVFLLATAAGLVFWSLHRQGWQRMRLPLPCRAELTKPNCDQHN